MEEGYKDESLSIPAEKISTSEEFKEFCLILRESSNYLGTVVVLHFQEHTCHDTIIPVVLCRLMICRMNKTSRITTLIVHTNWACSLQ